jgi:signal transduction histidine kinase
MESSSAKVMALPSPGAYNRLQAAHSDSAELAAVLAGADVGLALFDVDLKLLAANALYQSLCGYKPEELVQGTTLADMMRLSLSRQNTAEAAISQTIETALSRLDPGSSYTFRYTAPSSRVVEVRRRRLQSGTIVETVREVDSVVSSIDLSTQFSQIADAARARMMHALDVMADGFALYDADDRLVVYNKKYVDLNPKITDLIMPGAAFSDKLRAAIDRGAYALNGMAADSYYANRLHRHMNPGEPYEAQMSDNRWVLINEKRTADGGIVKIRSDISEMKHRELDLLRISQQLHAKNGHFDVALNNMIQGLCMFDKDQRLIVCNRRYLELYGFSDDVVKPGILLVEIMRYSASLGNYTAEEAERAISERQKRSSLQQRMTIKQRLKDGRVIAVMNQPMPDGGTIATYQDVTETERYQVQMQDYTKKLERSNQELQEFAYVASHDLQEPLRKIEAFGDRLMRRYGDTLPDEGKMFVDRMQHAAGRMRRLINDLLSYSRVTSKTNPYVEVCLTETLQGVLSDLQIRTEETKATINAPQLPKIDADPTQMRQLLQNLIGNALKFRKKDVAPVIKIDATVETDSLEATALGPILVLTLADNGIGFDNRYKDQIFKIFQRLHGRLEYEGTGVGLATCRKIVERHHGSIDADGIPDQGATFTIRMPMKKPQEDTTTVVA